MLEKTVSRSVVTTSLDAQNGTRYGGVVAVPVTPCLSAGVVDPMAMKRLCRELESRRCNGIFIAGSTGEMSLLDEADRRSLTVAACEATGPRALIYVGVTGFGLKQTIGHARNTARDGADVAVVMAPFYFRFSQPEVVAYLTAVADASPIPVALYHHPRMPTPLSVDTIAIVAAHPNVVAVKYTSTEIDKLPSLVTATAGTNLSVLQGNEKNLQLSYSAGATGGMVTALAGVVPEWHVCLYRALQEGNERTATEMQNRIVRLWRMLRIEAVQQSISAFTYSLKLALFRRGWIERLDGMMPGFVPDEGFRQEVNRQLDAAGVPDGSYHFQTESGCRRIDPPNTARPTPDAARVETTERQLP